MKTTLLKEKLSQQKNNMANFTSDFTISAETRQEAETKLKSIQMIVSKLNTKELVRLAEVVEKEPMKMAMAKKALGV